MILKRLLKNSSNPKSNTHNVKRKKKQNLWKPKIVCMETKNEKQKQSFLISEASPDIVATFGRLRKVAETRQNQWVKNEIINGLRLLWFAFGELHQQLDMLYTKVCRLEKENQRHREVIKSICRDTGADANLHREHLRINAMIKSQLAGLRERGMI
jgi:hypothetical protein